MDTSADTAKVPLLYNRIPKRVSRQDCNRYVAPHLTRPKKGPKPKRSLSKIFNYILSVLHTGIQWEPLRTNRNELPDTNVYKWPHRWSKDGVYQALFAASVLPLHDTKQLDTSVLHGDGSNTVVNKGATALVTPAINTRKAKKR